MVGCKGTLIFLLDAEDSALLFADLEEEELVEEKMLVLAYSSGPLENVAYFFGVCVDKEDAGLAVQCANRVTVG